MKRAILSILATATLLSANVVEAKSILNDLQKYKKIFDEARAKSAADPNFDYHDSRVTLWDIYGKSQKADLTEGSALHSPWSGSSWSFNRGSTALRYKDQTWLKLTETDFTFKTHEKLYDLYQMYPPRLEKVIGVDSKLSPVEKYDALLDDDYFGMTESTWKKLFDDFAAFERQTGLIPDYFGYCDGWAVASSIHPKPLRPVTLTSPFAKRSITFDVPDIRALISMYHQSNPNLSYQMLGYRCSRGYECEIVNPGLFHLAITNRIGHDKKPLLYDSSEDDAVWNKVIKDFSVRYYNPHNDVVTKKKGTDINKYKHDYARPGFKRDINMTHTVGVEMTLSVVRLRTRYDLVDAVSTYTYYYELELDRDNNIVGGEWLHDVGANPDFVWFVEDGNLFNVDEVDGDKVPNSVWKRASYDSHNRGLLHPWIIKQLIEKSTQPLPTQP